MKKTTALGTVTLLLIPALAAAQSVFDGTWKLNVNNAQLPKKPDVYVLQNGTYQCKTCAPPIAVKADGEDQKVTGHPHYDTLAIKVVDDHTIEEIAKKDGKVVNTSKTIVSPDGTTATVEFSDSTASNGDPVIGKAEETRVVKGPVGAHAISGSWRTTKFENVSDNGLTVTYKLEGNTLTMSTPIGQSYTAKLDGTDAPFKGDPGTTSVSVRRLGKNAIEETDKRDGKAIVIYNLTVSPDGRKMTIAVNDKLHGTTSQYTADKQ